MRYGTHNEDAMANPAPGFLRKPDHTITLREGVAASVSFDGVTVAVTRAAVMLEEVGYPPRAYIPRADIVASLNETTKRTHCPFKGDTRYFAVSVEGAEVPDAAWTYPEPFDEMLPIAGLIAFDDRFSLSLE